MPRPRRGGAARATGASELREALAEVIALYREHGVLLRAVVEASAYDEAVGGFWRALVGRFVDASRRRIETEQAAGPRRPPCPPRRPPSPCPG